MKKENEIKLELMKIYLEASFSEDIEEAFDDLPKIYRVGEITSLNNLHRGGNCGRNVDENEVIEDFIINADDKKSGIQNLQIGAKTTATFETGPTHKLLYDVEITQIDNYDEIVKEYKLAQEREEVFEWYEYLKDIKVEILDIRIKVEKSYELDYIYKWENLLLKTYKLCEYKYQ